jgi:hypothetical protein
LGGGEIEYRYVGDLPSHPVGFQTCIAGFLVGTYGQEFKTRHSSTNQFFIYFCRTRAASVQVCPSFPPPKTINSSINSLALNIPIPQMEYSFQNILSFSLLQICSLEKKKKKEVKFENLSIFLQIHILC